LLFQQLAEANLETLAQNKVRKIVTICPHCVRTIEEDWKEYGTPPPVEHHSEFMARFADKLPSQATQPASVTAVRASEGAGGFNPRNPVPTKVGALATELAGFENHESGHDFSRAESSPLKAGALAPAANPPTPEKIVFHDPCYLGRYRNVYDEPRAIVAQAGQLIEAPRNHERSFCCGAGGGLAFLGEESGQRVSHNRVQELIATGATTIAAACPFCNTMLNDALAATGDAAPQLVDIAQLAARRLPDYHGQESK
jgi:Fe-S oxidoreductase